MAKTKVLTLEGLKIFWQKIQSRLETRISAIEEDINTASSEISKIIGE